jgi:hypothetical protein
MSARPTPTGRVLMVDIEGTRLDADTAAFRREHQIRQLTADLRAVMGTAGATRAEPGRRSQPALSSATMS